MKIALKFKIVYGVMFGALMVCLLCAVLKNAESGTIDQYIGKTAAQLSAMVDYQTIANTAYWNSHAYAQLESIFTYLDSAGVSGGVTSLGYCSLADTSGSVTFQDIIDSCNAIYVPADTFELIEEVGDTAHLIGHSNMTIFGNGVSSVLKMNKEAYGNGYDVCQILRFDNDSNIVISGVKFVADTNQAHWNAEHDHCLLLNSCKNVLIVNCDFEAACDGIALFGNSTNIRILNCTFKGDSLPNFDYDPPRESQAPRCAISIVPYANSVSWPYSASIDNVIINGCTFDGFCVGQVVIIPYQDPPLSYRLYARNIVISNNTFKNFYGTLSGSIYRLNSCVYINMGEANNSIVQDITISGNTFLNNKRPGIDLWGNVPYDGSHSNYIKTVNIVGNTFYNTPSKFTHHNATIFLYQRVEHISITDNTICKSYGCGITVSDQLAIPDTNVVSINIESNMIDSCYYGGVNVTTTDDDTIYNVNIIGNDIDRYALIGGNTYSGIYLNCVRNGIVNDNTVHYSSGTDEALCGIYFRYCSNATFLGNTVTSGQYPIGWLNLSETFNMGHNIDTSLSVRGLPPMHADVYGTLKADGTSDFFKVYSFVNDWNVGVQGGLMVLAERGGIDTLHYFDAQGFWYHRPIFMDTVSVGVKEGTFKVSREGDSLMGYLQSGWRSIWPVVYDSTDMYQIVNVHAHGIEDDSTDQTSALQTLVESYPSGTEFYFPRVHDGKYYFAGTVKLAQTTGKEYTFRFDPSTTVYADTHWIEIGSGSLAKGYKAIADTCGINSEKVFFTGGDGAYFEGYKMMFLFAPSTYWYNSVSYKRGELSLIRRIEGDTIWVDGNLHDNYQYPGMVTNVHRLDVCSFKCYDLNLEYTYENNNGVRAIKVTYGLGCRFERCHIKNAHQEGLYLSFCYDTIVESCSFEGCNLSGQGYAIAVLGSMYTSILNCHSWNNREFVTAGSHNGWPIARHIYCSGNFIRGGGKLITATGADGGDMWDGSGGQKAFDSHEPVEFFHITGNTIHGVYYGAYMRGNFCTFNDNVCSGRMYSVYNHTYGGNATVNNNVYEPALLSRSKLIGDDGTTDDPRYRQVLYPFFIASTCKSDSLVNWTFNNNRINGCSVAFFTSRAYQVNVQCDNNWVRFANYDNSNIYFLYTVGDTRVWYRSSFQGNTVHVMEDATLQNKNAQLTLDNSVKIRYLLVDEATGTSKFVEWPTEIMQTTDDRFFRPIYLLSGDTLYYEVWPPDSLMIP